MANYSTFDMIFANSQQRRWDVINPFSWCHLWHADWMRTRLHHQRHQNATTCFLVCCLSGACVLLCDASLLLSIFIIFLVIFSFCSHHVTTLINIVKRTKDEIDIDLINEKSLISKWMLGERVLFDQRNIYLFWNSILCLGTCPMQKAKEYLVLNGLRVDGIKSERLMTATGFHSFSRVWCGMEMRKRWFHDKYIFISTSERQKNCATETKVDVIIASSLFAYMFTTCKCDLTNEIQHSLSPSLRQEFRIFSHLKNVLSAWKTQLKSGCAMYGEFFGVVNIVGSFDEKKKSLVNNENGTT